MNSSNEMPRKNNKNGNLVVRVHNKTTLLETNNLVIDSSLKVCRRSAKITELSAESLQNRHKKIESIKQKIAQGNYYISGAELLKAMFS